MNAQQLTEFLNSITVPVHVSLVGFSPNSEEFLVTALNPTDTYH